MPAKRHMKLSDVEAQKTYFLPRTPTTFENAFPTVETMRVEVRPEGEGFRPFHGQQEWIETYVNGQIPTIINCRNPRCYGGGLNLGYELRWAIVEAKRTEFEHVYFCDGYEGSPKGRKKYGDCDTRFKVKITVKYKDAG